MVRSSPSNGSVAVWVSQPYIEKLNIKKASCHNHITPKMLRLGSNGIEDSITKLYKAYESI